MSGKPLVVAAMSGGVDSSVAAALLLEQGYEVVGMMLRLWSEPGSEDSNRCCTPDAMAQARRVAGKLGIPFYALDVRESFRKVVVQHFLDGYLAGITPNPCLVCNREIRWGFLYDQARALGAEYMATGHYARVRNQPEDGVQLLGGVDRSKDQSYVISILPQEKLSHSLFPIGELQKSEVRDIARKLELSSAERPDSQDLCFLAGQDYRGFLGRYEPTALRPGIIQNSEGEEVGRHAGLANYTIGQRKGLGIAGAKPMYVLEKDVKSNVLRVGFAEELKGDELFADEVNWISGSPPGESFHVQVKIRYKAKEADGEVKILQDGRVRVRFMQPLRDITPGQRAVFYQDDLCLGGGVIQG